MSEGLIPPPPATARRHSSAHYLTHDQPHYAADWIRATNNSARAYRAASLALGTSGCQPERSLLDILMQNEVEKKQQPVQPQNPFIILNNSPPKVNDAVPPPIPARPPPVPERSRPAPPQSTPPPPPVVPRARPPPPPAPPRATHHLQASKAQLSSSLNAQPPNSVTTDSTSERRQSSKPPQDTEAVKYPPPRPQAPNNVKTSLPDPPRKKSFKIPPPLPTQAACDEEKLAHILLQNESINGSVGKISMRQDSNVSSDSFSQNSSPSYTTKSMETPLLAQCGKKSKHKYLSSDKRSKERRERCSDEAVSSVTSDDANNALTKSHSTPASLQTIVRFHNGSNMSIHHRIINDMRRPSTHYITRGRLKFQFAQVVLNAIALLAIAGGLAAYFQAYPSAVRYINRTITEHTVVTPPWDVNPAPGICLPVIVTFCLQHKIPYNYTMFPNYIGHFTQRDAQQELEVYDAVEDVRCYELAALFLCSVFVPKCGPSGQLVRPCRNLCAETKRRCGFFLDVFGLTLPEYLDCDLFPESEDSDVCVGHKEVIEADKRAQKPVCLSGFQCDVKRCIPADWRCDGHIDCEDQTDELNCHQCARGMIHCGSRTCMDQSHMCDGVKECPWGQDERNCIRLSERMGDESKGKLEVFQPSLQSWKPACMTSWDPLTSPKAICSMLGYRKVNASNLAFKGSVAGLKPSITKYTSLKRYSVPKRNVNLLKELRDCNTQNFAPIELACSNFACGVRHQYQEKKISTRIVGGTESSPGDWPFLAALLGGPEQIFYCAGVLISDQWVLTASHCVGNFTNGDLSGWTIQLGITRRHAHSYFGQKMKVKRVVPHPMYNQGAAHDNDIALFQLASKVTFHEHLLPVCLPPPNQRIMKEGTLCTVIGWGKREDSDVSEYEAAINEVQVPILNRDRCNSWLEHRDINITQGMICAGYAEGGKDACQGDSGGPLLCQMDGYPQRWFVGGIVSWGIKCAHPHLPGVYAFVPRYVPWIEQQMAIYSEK